MYNPTCTYTPPEQPCRVAVFRGLVVSALDFGAASQFAFSVKDFFWVHGVESLPSHILTKFCLLGYQGIPQFSRAMGGQMDVRPLPQWTGKVGLAENG